jgi:hypothetical protein
MFFLCTFLQEQVVIKWEEIFRILGCFFLLQILHQLHVHCIRNHMKDNNPCHQWIIVSECLTTRGNRRCQIFYQLQSRIRNHAYHLKIMIQLQQLNSLTRCRMEPFYYCSSGDKNTQVAHVKWSVPNISTEIKINSWFFS